MVGLADHAAHGARRPTLLRGPPYLQTSPIRDLLGSTSGPNSLAESEPPMSHETMSSRQRVLAALNHQVPDRVPIDLGGNQTGIHKFAYQAVAKLLGIDDSVVIMDAVQQLAQPSEALLERFHVDTRYIAAGAAADFKGGIVQRQRDGRTLARPDRRVRRDLVDARRPAVLHGHLAPSAGQRHDRRHPRSYPFPKGDDPGRFAGLRQRALEIRQQTPYAVVSGISGVVYEICWYLRGLETWFMDMLTQPEFCEALIDQTLKFWMDWFRVFLDEVGDVVDVIMIGDDLAAQKGPLFRPEFYRRVVKPRHKQLVQYIRSRTQAKIWYHTCGACVEYIPDLLDNGIDILNPVQISASRDGAGRPEGPLRRPPGVLGRRDRHPARLAAGLGRDRPRGGAAEPGTMEARRRLRVQQRPQHSGGRSAGEHRGLVRCRL